MDITIEWLQRLVDRLNGELARTAMERLSPVLFPPTQLQAVVTEIKNNLPTCWALTPATQAGNMWKSYQEATVTAASIENGIRLFIHIPIFEFTRTLTLYRVIGLARATTNGSTSQVNFQRKWLGHAAQPSKRSAPSVEPSAEKTTKAPAVSRYSWPTITG